MKNPVLLSLAVSFVLVSAGAMAFPFGKSWHGAADGTQSTGGRAGAGGIYGTGGALDFYTTCGSCHIKSAGLIDVTVVPTPAWNKVQNLDAYKPGQVYSITVNMVGEHLGLNQGNDNLNGMAVTIEDQGGKAQGVLVSDTNPPVSSASCPASYPAQDPASGTTYLYGDCHGVFFIPRANTTSWTFSWTAPSAGTGKLSIFYGVVDGDHHGSSSLGDDVKMGVVKLEEGP